MPDGSSAEMPERRAAHGPGWIWWAAGGVAVLGVALAATGSALFGKRVRWENAYRTFQIDAPSRLTPERERVLVANALAESDPPAGLAESPRLHPPGSLAHLRYEALDEGGLRIDAWEVRALVPSLGSGPGPIWTDGCPPACEHALARERATRIVRSGDPGLAGEWVLRLAPGRTYDLGARTLVTQDILDDAPRRIGIRSVREGDRTVTRPAAIQVTLDLVCQPDVRVGSVTQLEFHPHAIVPIPRGLKTTRWVQMSGCGTLAPLPAPLRADAAPSIADEPIERTAPRTSSVPEPLPPGAVVLRRESGSGFNALRVDERWLADHGAPIAVHVRHLCRYDESAREWQPLPAPMPGRTIRIVPQPPEAASKGDRIVFEIPRQIGLFWVQWTEAPPDTRSARSVATRDAYATSGPMLCEDLTIGPAPEGFVAACVPFPDRAEARFVPRADRACGR